MALGLLSFVALQRYHLWQGAKAEVDSGRATRGTGNGSKGPAKSSSCHGFKCWKCQFSK